jgi:hypothetical protein
MLVEVLETEEQFSSVNQAAASGNLVGISFTAACSKTGKV